MGTSTISNLIPAVGQTVQSYWNDLTGQNNTSTFGAASYVSQAGVDQGLSGNQFGSAGAITQQVAGSAFTAGGTVVQAAGKAANAFDSSITTALILAGLLVAGVVLILATGAGESLKKGVIPV